MKKSRITLALALVAATLLTSGTAITGCQTSSENVEKAQEKVKDAEQELKVVQKDANEEAMRVASAEEWQAFKDETELKIKGNEVRIAELKNKMKTSGKTLDSMYEQRITDLEQKNKDLRARMLGYDKNQSNWETFKREFNHDMDELGKALKDLTIDNKK
jgi:chromosome segregation ATPase